MGLLKLLGGKADVIKMFAKRCNAHWDVAPTGEIGLYLGDIQGIIPSLHLLTFRSYRYYVSEFIDF
jgi:magnesium transporter